MTVLIIAFALGHAHAKDSGWVNWGGGIHNQRNASSERKISPETVADLSVSCQYETISCTNVKDTTTCETHPEEKLTIDGSGNLLGSGDASANVTIKGNRAYAVDFGGYLHAFNAKTCERIWRKPITDYSSELVEGSGSVTILSRTSPAIAGNLLFIGDQFFAAVPESLDGADFMAINRRTGELVWKTKLDSFDFSIVTNSPVVFGNLVYVGVSSLEELIAATGDPRDPPLTPYDCCKFVGSIVALNKNTGEIVWRTPTIDPSLIPDPNAENRLAGNAVWGSSFSIDTKRNQLYVATGNIYDVPDDPDLAMCRVKQLAACDDDPTGVECRTSCVDEGNLIESIIALDLQTGAINWATPLGGLDAWNVSCFFDGLPIPNAENCPDPAGPDYDFGQSPGLFKAKVKGRGKGRGKGKDLELVGAGQKSGFYWALNPDNGEVVYSSKTGQGGVAGGNQWGSAVDGNRVYTSVTASSPELILTNPAPDSDPMTSGGVWSAIDAATGDIIWQAATPSHPDTGPVNAGGAATVANGVVFVGAQDTNIGTFYALDAATGQRLWSFPAGGSINGGASVVNGRVYWGCGYGRGNSVHRQNPEGSGETGENNCNQIYVFKVP